MSVNKYYAFFDVDGTLLKGISLLAFLKVFYQRKYEHLLCVGKLAYRFYLIKAWGVNKIIGSREHLNRLYYKCYRNQPIDYVANIGEDWYQAIKRSENSFHEEVIDELRWHQRRGGEIVFVSGSFNACLKPLANDLDVQNFLCTELLVENGKYTGDIKSSLIGSGKVKAIQNFINTKNFRNINDCYAYGDHMSDLPMLKLVGNPRVVAGNADVELWATQNEIPILR